MALVGKSHKVIQALVPVENCVRNAYRLAIQMVQNPCILNAVEVRTAIERIQYEIDKVAMEDATKPQQ